MKNTIKKFILIVSTFMFISCHFQQQEIIPKPETKPQLAFFCQLNNDYFFQTIPAITYTSNIGQPIKWDFNYGDTISKDPLRINPINSPLYLNLVADAKVEIFEEGKLFRRMDTIISGNHFYSIRDSVHFNYGKEYTLKVFKEGYDSVIGKQYFPRNYAMDTNSVKLSRNTVTNLKYEGLPLSELIFEINDALLEKNAYTFRVDIDNYDTPDTDKIVNMQQGLSTYLIDRNAINDLFISDSTFNGQKYFWHVGINLNPNSFSKPFPVGKNQKLAITVYFKSTSPDYILYLKSIANNGVSVSSPIVEPTSPYFNMKGGAGLFIASAKEYRVRIPIN